MEASRLSYIGAQLQSAQLQPEYPPGVGDAFSGAPSTAAHAQAIEWRENLEADSPAAVHRIAAAGVAGAHAPLPHLDRVQRAFGAHRVEQVGAMVGGAGADAADRIGAQAYAFGEATAFGDAPDLHTAAHEAAHVVQQRGGAQPTHGVGRHGDGFETHADAVADAVVRGDSAEPLLNRVAAPSATAAARPVVQRDDDETPDQVPPACTVVWGEDPFEVSFAASGEDFRRRIEFTVRYTGPHLTDGPFVQQGA
ncbi:MAG: DUF4157 domain-containing protein, partial [Myxococcales bacterium]|nr:DUF4157 domain-containing protein [Myxococcales bacterium]